MSFFENSGGVVFLSEVSVRLGSEGLVDICSGENLYVIVSDDELFIIEGDFCCFNLENDNRDSGVLFSFVGLEDFVLFYVFVRIS